MSKTKSKRSRKNKKINRMLFLAPKVAINEEEEASLGDFEILKMLGKGAFGKVYKVSDKKTQAEYAIKVIKKALVRQYQMMTQMENEVRIMYSLKHPNLVALFNHFEDNENIYLVLELSEQGQLFDKIKQKGRLDQKTAAKYTADLICGLEYMHGQDPPIIHRDIKPENLLISADETLKLADFGWSNFNKGEQMRNTYCGTPEYLAPEMVNEVGHTEKLDIWTVGVLLFELLVGHTPFYPKGAKDMAVFQSRLHYNILSGVIKYPADYPVLARDLTSKLLKLNPDDRPSIPEIKKHPWFKQWNLFQDEREKQKNLMEESLALDDEEYLNFDSASPDEDDIPVLASSEDLEEATSFVEEGNLFNKSQNQQSNLGKSQLIHSQFESQVKMNMSTIDDNNDLVIDLNNQLAQKKDQILKLNLRLKNLREDNGQGESILSKLQEDAKVLEQEGVMITNIEMKKFKMIEQEKARLENKYKELFNKFAQSDNEIDSLNNEIRNLEKIKESNERLRADNEKLRKVYQEKQQNLCDFGGDSTVNGDPDNDEIEILNTTIQEYENILFKVTPTNKKLAMREILESSFRSFDDIKLTIQANIENFVYDTEMQEKMNEINYKIKKKDIEFENRLENEKFKIHEEYEERIKQLKKAQAEEVEATENDMRKTKEKYERKLSEMKKNISEIEAKMEAIDEIMRLSVVKAESFSDMKNTVTAQKMVLEAKDAEIKTKLDKMEHLKEKINSLKKDRQYLKSQMQIFRRR